MWEPKKRPKDKFASTAISFILGVLVGLFIFLMGFIFFFLAFLATQSDQLSLTAETYVNLGVLSMIIGGIMTWYFLRPSTSRVDFLPD